MRPEDFEVEECVTQYYYDEKARGWRWHCIVCDTGTQIQKHGRRLHKCEGDAAVGAKYHRNQKKMTRQANRWRAWWYNELMTIKDIEAFRKHWQAYWWDHWPPMPDDKALEVMTRIQADEHFMELAKKYWTADQKKYGGKK